MAIRPKSVDIEIDGEKYTVSKYGGSKGTELFWTIMGLLGETIFRLILSDSMPKDESEKAKLAEALAMQLAGGFFTRLDGKAFTKLVKEILSETLEYGTSTSVTENYDLKFCGEQFHLLMLVAKTLQVQYQDFFEGFLKLKGLGLGKAM